MIFDTKVYLSPVAYVEVGVRWGKFVKIVKNEKFFYLSAENFNVFDENIASIESSHENNTKFEITFTKLKKLLTDSFRQNRTTSFSEVFEKDGQLYTKYVQLNEREWNALKLRMPTIKAFMSYDEAIMLGDDMGWSLLEYPAAVWDEAGAKERRLVPRMCNTALYDQLQRFLWHEGVNYLLSTVCSGCRGNHEAEGAHKHPGHGCKANWSSMVDVLFEGVYANTLELSAAVDLVNDALKWSIPKEDLPKKKTFEEAKAMIVAEHWDDGMPATCEHDECKVMFALYNATFKCVFCPLAKMFK